MKLNISCIGVFLKIKIVQGHPIFGSMW